MDKHVGAKPKEGVMVAQSKSWFDGNNVLKMVGDHVLKKKQC
jgi:hypothetical protein